MRGKAISDYKKNAIIDDILLFQYSTKELSEKHRVTYNVINRILSEVKLTTKYIGDTVPVCGRMSKNEAYWTEEEMLSCPFYNHLELKGKEKSLLKSKLPSDWDIKY